MTFSRPLTLSGFAAGYAAAQDCWRVLGFIPALDGVTAPGYATGYEAARAALARNE